jgi:hypothetical protein
MLTASSTETFVAAGKAWLKTVIAHPLLTDANKTFGTALYLKFNFKHYEKTGELKAWPGWDTLTAEAGLSRWTVNESARQLEQFQLLEVLRGRYDRAAQKREGNEYFARFPSAPQGVEFVPCQGVNFTPNPRCEIQTVIGESPFLKGESIKGESANTELIPEKVKRGLPRKEGQKASKPSKDSSPSKVPSLSKTPHPPSSARPPSPLGDRWADRWRKQKAQDKATLEHYRAKAQNGGGQ